MAASDVYWSALDPSEILSVPTAGGDAVVVAAPAVTYFGGGMAVVDGVIYWSGGSDVGTSVFATTLDGTTTELAVLTPCAADPGIAVDGDFVVAATFACDGNPAELVAVPRAGGEAVHTLLASEAIRFVAGEGAAQLVIGDELLAIPVAGGSGTRLAGITDGEVVGRDASDIFTSSGNRILAIPAGGGEPVQIGPLLEARPALAAADPDHVFAITGGFDHGQASLIAIPRGGDEAQALVDNLGDAGALTADADALYWTAPDDDSDRGGLWRIAKCAAD
ncbi:MAG: hypothetical protein ABI867_28435 [Kofleriaceae bacterium]